MLLHSINGTFDEQKVVNFNEVNVLSMFPFSGFCDPFRKSLPTQYDEDTLLSSQSFIVLLLALRSVVHLELKFVYGVMWGGGQDFF